METFTTHLYTFITNMEILYNSQLTPLKFSQTAFSISEQDIDIDFLSRVLTSHLQTHGYSVVIGDDEKAVNMLVDTLSLFLIDPQDRKRSSRVIGKRGFIPDLIIQGILDSQERQNTPDEDIIQSLFPITMIDLKSQSVKQTHPYHEYSVLRKEYMDLELMKLTSNKTLKEWQAKDGLFKTMRTNSILIENILKDAFGLPRSLRETFLAQSVKGLIRKSVLLIKYVEAELEKNKNAHLEHTIVKKVRADLDLGNENDFGVLLGISEKLSPGIYVALAGDPASIEEKFVELFESF